MHIFINPLILFQTAPGGVFTVPQEITMMSVISRGADLVVVENRRGIVLRLGFCGRLGLRVRSCLGRCRYRYSCLCRCTPATSGCLPRRSGCVSGRYSSRRVCLGVLWKAFCQTGRRRMSRFGIAGGLFDFGADELVF